MLIWFDLTTDRHRQTEIQFVAVIRVTVYWPAFPVKSKSNKKIQSNAYLFSVIHCKRIRGLGLDRIGYIKQLSLYVTFKTRNTGASSAVISQIVLIVILFGWRILMEQSKVSVQMLEGNHMLRSVSIIITVS